MQNLTDLHNAISAIEDFSHSSQLPFPEDVKQMVLREEFPKLVQQLREAFEKLKPKENVHAIPRKSAFPIRGTIRTT
ncbi:hypothetical protein [Empedobacter tilapiae]|uniref:hypothetical protein n=1 Tax=Empedobacter tilapiae TaxID=2491114 RepID=UPI0028D18FED|nr:hypothetical protein [Empedobacter tilapiae]